MKIENKKQLKEILSLLNSPDYESRVLGYNLFQSSKFRKYIRNKCYRHIKSSSLLKFSFILNPLVCVFRSKNYWKNSVIKDKNEHKIHTLKTMLTEYIKGNLIFYDYSRYKR